MALQDRDARPGRCIPHAAGPVQGRRDDRSPIRTEAGCQNLVLVAVEHGLLGGGLPVPRTRLSMDAVTICVPSGLRAADQTGP